MNIHCSKKTLKRIGVIVAIIVGIPVGWFGVVLVLRPWNAVKILDLPHNTNASHRDDFHTLRVGCYNIAHGRGRQLGVSNWEGSWREKRERVTQIGRFLKAEDLDIVVLNEVDFSSVWSGHVNQARLIAAEANYPYLVEQRNIDVAIPFLSFRFGNAILSKYPILDAIFLNYPKVPTLSQMRVDGIKKGVAATIVLPNEANIRVVGVHLSVNSEPVRMTSAQMILDLQHGSPLPMIAMGDFNTAPRGYPQYYADDEGRNSVELFIDSPLLTTHLPPLPLRQEDLTFPAEHPDRVLDWIFVSPSWHLREKRVIVSDLSDHFPVIAELTQDKETE